MISFPPLGEEDGTKRPMVIEAEVGGHLVHRIYVDGGETLPISKLDCVLSQDWIAFCLKIGLRFVSRLDCVLSQDLIAFCLKTSCVLSTF
ncbi:hypothetical protein Tco_0436262, partial [Tanacetum coccineum]